MGIFDKMFGKGASAAQAAPDATKRFEELKAKYQSVLNLIQQQKVQLHNLHVQDNKLFIKGTAPSEQAKNAVWDQIKLVNPTYDDLIADFDVAAPAAAAPAMQTYTVKPGDTLSKIAKQFYGDANEYMRIFYANEDQLNDPDLIKVGQVLKIPSENA